MIQVHVKDVLGPIPVENSCYIVLSAGSKTFAVQSSYADAETCSSLLRGEIIGPNPYEFMNDVLNAVDIKLNNGILECVNGSMYGRILFKTDRTSKPLKIACNNPCAIINATFAASSSLEISKTVLATTDDITTEYHRVKACFAQLFPLPNPDSTDLLRVLSEFVDKVQYKQVA